MRDVTKKREKNEGMETDFAGENEGSHEDPFTGPAFGGDPKVGLRSLDIDEGDEHDSGADSGCADHPPHKLSEPAVFLLAVVRCTIKRRGGFATEGVVCCFEGGMHDVF